MGRKKPIASPRDDYYQGRGTKPSDVELGKSPGGSEAEIRRLMAPQAKGPNSPNEEPKTRRA